MGPSPFCIFKVVTDIPTFQREKQPLARDDVLAQVTTRTLEFVQTVISDTATHISSVPANFGTAAAGSIEADEWRILTSIYLPIPLVILWGDLGPSSPNLAALDHTVALFQAIKLMCLYSTSQDRAERFRNHLKYWVDNLYRLYPHTRDQHRRTNIHVAFHIQDFSLLFGPVMGWWAFPFERMFGFLQSECGAPKDVRGERGALKLELLSCGALF